MPAQGKRAPFGAELARQRNSSLLARPGSFKRMLGSLDAGALLRPPPPHTIDDCEGDQSDEGGEEVPECPTVGTAEEVHERHEKRRHETDGEGVQEQRDEDPEAESERFGVHERQSSPPREDRHHAGSEETAGRN